MEQKKTANGKCFNCGAELSEAKIRRRAKYCNDECSREYFRDLWRQENPIPKISPASRGSISELIVCADLLSRGYSVFRSLSPVCPCDIALLVDHTLLRIEVTTGYKLASGKLTYPKHDPKNYDIVAVVLSKTAKIIYIPPLHHIPFSPAMRASRKK